MGLPATVEGGWRWIARVAALWSARGGRVLRLSVERVVRGRRRVNLGGMGWCGPGGGLVGCPPSVGRG